jgi:hypothetical protein
MRFPISSFSAAVRYDLCGAVTIFRVSVFFMDPRFNIPLTDPRLGKELVKDPKGPLPINVWCRYCGEYAGADYESLPVFQWVVDRSWPKPILPQQAVDKAVPLAYETIQHLKSGSSEKALASVKRAWEILFIGSSDWRRGRGQPASMRLPAVRAYTVRKFNPDPKKPGESIVTFREVADMLFRSNAKCSRCHSPTRHEPDSACVRALQESIRRLLSAMKDANIPV